MTRTDYFGLHSTSTSMLQVVYNNCRNITTRKQVKLEGRRSELKETDSDFDERCDDTTTSAAQV